MYTDYLREHWLWVSFVTVCAVILIWLIVAYREKIGKFLNETWIELKKASWPWDPKETGLRRYKELIDSTVVVIISTILLGGFVTFSDTILTAVIGYITRYGLS